jgi:1,2-diacylglycerol 3-beta-galactosyltransferase
MADYPPHFWMERQDQYFICGTDKAVEQARQLGHPLERIFRSPGMILNPKFHLPVEVDRAVERKRLGLDPDRPTALVLFGGYGSSDMTGIARRLDDSGLKMQTIMICGHSQKLAARLRGMTMKAPMHVEGFTREVPYFMRLADFFIGKPGPGSISEALAMQLPVIVERNAWTLPQERYNADWVREQGVGLVLDSFRGITQATAELLEPANYARFRTAVASQKNRAVFEIPDMLAKILEN